MSAGGEVIRSLNDDEVRALASRLRELDVESVAVCLLHAHRHPCHERRVGEILRSELPGVAVSLSSAILREQQEYERTAASVVNAYVRPLMARYSTMGARDRRRFSRRKTARSSGIGSPRLPRLPRTSKC